MEELSSTSAIYPISANPPTNGHFNILSRCANCFNQVYWVAAKNPEKDLYFTNQERVDMLRDYIDYHRLKNVTVDIYDGAIVRYAEKKNIRFLIRGLRNSTDFQQEFVLAAGNREINEKVETICIFAESIYTTMSSSMVIQLTKLGENIDNYVIPPVAEKVLKKIKKDHFETIF